MNEKIKKTALETSAGTDEKQSLINSNNIITDEDDFAIVMICLQNSERKATLIL